MSYLRQLEGERQQQEACRACADAKPQKLNGFWASYSEEFAKEGNESTEGTKSAMKKEGCRKKLKLFLAAR